MKKRYILLNIVAYTGISLSIVTLVYLGNILLLSSNDVISPTDALFIEGMMSILSGCLLLLGRGGLNFWSHKAAILSSAAEAAYGEETVGPAEIMRRDAWKSKGFIRAGLISLITGLLMLVVYITTL